jgi:hypothetical protein
MIEMTRKQPTGNDGYEITRFNALRHGVLSRYTVLPWEDQDEYCSLLDALVAEHKPEGPTEEHLVEEITGILWRKRRLRLAEGAACRRGLNSATSPDRQIVKTALVHLMVGKQMALDTAKELADLDEDRAITTRAVDLLEAGKGRAYERRLGVYARIPNSGGRSGSNRSGRSICSTMAMWRVVTPRTPTVFSNSWRARLCLATKRANRN